MPVIGLDSFHFLRVYLLYLPLLLFSFCLRITDRKGDLKKIPFQRGYKKLYSLRKEFRSVKTGTVR